MKQIYPEQGLKAACEEFLAVMNPQVALDGKTKELIGLAVAALFLASDEANFIIGGVTL